MSDELLNEVASRLGPNGLPYAIPIHPNLVHLTLGLFIIAIAFDVAGTLFPLERPLLKILAIPATRSNFYDVGWYNLLAASIITFFTVAAGFFEMFLATPAANLKSAWGLGPTTTMLAHGVGGVILLFFMVAMTVWRGFQRFSWRKDRAQQVQWTYLGAGFVMLFLLFVHGTLGAHLGAEFGVHVTADDLLRIGQDPNAVLR
ncbi:DUF2231 domain-containing protein [Leptolyngbya sp. AN02str]|uniref:DUF2231 domain-containing protein n=1 Tax=Leptolyngbya sp. AN02str TaxID=3423363 RepID=UPI003D316052